MKRKMDAPEIASKLGMSIRHARRLRAEDDERCYTDSYSTDERPTPQRPDALEALRDGMKALSEAWLFGCWRPIFVPHEYSNPPENGDDIDAATRKYFAGVNALRDAIGLYSEDDPDGTENDGLPTVYQRHELNMPIQQTYRPLIEKWAKKYGKTLKPELFFE